MTEDKAKVVITDYVSDTDEESKILAQLADITAPLAESEDALIGCIEDADALMVYHFVNLTDKTMERLRNCRLIVRCGVGYDNIDVQAARRCGIPVANVPDYGTEEVADSAIGLILAMTRGFALLERRMRERRGLWSPTEAGPLRRLRGRVLGIVGLGRIGKATALRARALGMDVAFYDPYVPDGTDKSLGIRREESLQKLLAAAHVVSMHCPLTEETTHMIGADALAQMREGAYLVNTARGAVVDAQAVLAAVTSGHLSGAALDVLEHEPPDDDDDPLIVAWRDPTHPASDRLIINPHAAFYSLDGLLDMRIKGAQNIRRVLLGESPRNVVN